MLRLMYMTPRHLVVGLVAAAALMGCGSSDDPRPVDRVEAADKANADALTCTGGPPAITQYNVQPGPEGEGASSTPEAAVALLMQRADRFALSATPFEEDAASLDEVNLRYEDRDASTSGQQATFGARRIGGGWYVISYSACPEVERFS